MKSLLIKIFNTISSLKLTIVCLSAAMVLVFAGTLAQVQLGIQIVQEQYFQSLVVWWPVGVGDAAKFPVFPGGHLIGGVLLLNLIAAHIRRFRWRWDKAGIQLTHAGLIIMLAGGVMTDLFSVESHMRIKEGETKNYSEEIDAVELAVVDSSNPKFDQVTAIPSDNLKEGELIMHDSLPFQFLVKKVYANSRLKDLGAAEMASMAACSQGLGKRVAISKQPITTKPNERNMMSAVIEIIPGPNAETENKASLGSWVVSDGLAGVQNVELDGKKWSFSLRPRRHYKPFSLKLHDFVHERYPGTQIPKNFSSRVTLADTDGSPSREVLIYMNHPLRYGGETFYQSGFERDEETTVLQVIRNPSVAAPYVACIVVGLGLLIQFSMHLVKFSRRASKAPAGTTPQATKS